MFMSIRYRMDMGSAQRLTPDDWCTAALAVIAERGVAGLSIEALAKSLGVTKGSFYWHFADRSALVVAAASMWERRATGEVIEELSAIEDPRRRLRTLLEVSFSDSVNGPIDAAMAGRSEDRTVGATVARVTMARLNFIESIFVELGLDAERAARRARVAYAAYLGHFPLANALPGDPTLSAVRSDYLDELVDVLVVDAPGLGRAARSGDPGPDR